MVSQYEHAQLPTIKQLTRRLKMSGEVKYTKMTGLLVPYQNKGGGSYNLDFPIRQNPMSNETYLGGVSIIVDFGVEGMTVTRGASITTNNNPQYGTVRNELKSFFKDRPSANWWTLDETDTVKVMFDFLGCSDSYDSKNDRNYQNVHIGNIELVKQTVSSLV